MLRLKEDCCVDRRKVCKSTPIVCRLQHSLYAHLYVTTYNRKSYSYLGIFLSRHLVRILHTAVCGYGPKGYIVHSLTHSGRDVVQTGLECAAPFFFVVRNVGLQEGNTKLPLIHHAYQAAFGLTWSLSWHHQTDREKVMSLHAHEWLVMYLIHPFNAVKNILSSRCLCGKTNHNSYLDRVQLDIS